MKNCLDWLEVTANRYEPYLTDKTVGLVCWADGLQAMQGINAMDVIAKSLRAWPLPFSVPIVRSALFDGDDKRRFPRCISISLKSLSALQSQKNRKTTINHL